MTQPSSKRFPDAFTLVETCVTLAVVALVGGLAYSMLMNSATLLAKNLSINSSNLTVRSALDRVYAELNEANKMPILINADGTLAPKEFTENDGTATPGAAGILVDRYLGGPFIVGNPGSGLSATATTLNLFYSTDPMANPVPPAENDVIFMDGSTRARVDSCTPPTTTFTAPMPAMVPSPGGRMVKVTLQAPLGSYKIPPIAAGTAIAWTSTTLQSAYVIHRKAFVVVPVNGTVPDPKTGLTPSAELRMYPDAEGLTNFNDPTQYEVLARSMGTKVIGGLNEHAPFSLVKQNLGMPTEATFLNIAMRVEDQQFNKRLASQQAKEFNTFLRIDTLLRPRNIP